MTLSRLLLICGIAAFSAALTIGIPVTAPKHGPRPFVMGEPQMADVLMGNYPANIELIETPEGARISSTTWWRTSRSTRLGGRRWPRVV